ncbi:MAG: LysR family transcriptional regulator substrate-binding protein [Coriobacteriales bacterium]|nr:LysR family transcriptional regulator substrate-binding protein [Coriobacteriales bacterium]
MATKATEIIQGCEDLKRYADALGCDSETGAFGSLRIAIASSPYEGSIISRALLDKLARRYPGIKLELIYSSSGAGLSALYEDVVDVSIVLGRVKMEQFTCIKLFESELRIAVDKLHPLAKRCCVPLSDVVSYPIAKPHDLRCCYQAIVAQFERINFSPCFVDLPPFIESCGRFLKEESGVVFVLHEPSQRESSFSDLYANVDLISLNQDERITVPVCIAWRKGNKEKLISLLQKSLIRSLKDERRMAHKNMMG